MMSFSWEWPGLPLEDRLLHLFVWIRKERERRRASSGELDFGSILEQARLRVRVGTIKMRGEGSNGCYNGGFHCFSIYSSCVALPNTGHSLAEKREYYIAVLATFLQKENPSAKEVERALTRSLTEEPEIRYKMGAEYLSS